jgi:hypothetical protein
MKPPTTGVGIALKFVLPSPSCPRSFLPQQYVWPEVAIPHTCPLPTLNVSKRSVVEIGSRIGGSRGPEGGYV